MTAVLPLMPGSAAINAAISAGRNAGSSVGFGRAVERRRDVAIAFKTGLGASRVPVAAGAGLGALSGAGGGPANDPSFFKTGFGTGTGMMMITATRKLGQSMQKNTSIDSN